jgi:condensin-2 complex subunit D3
VLFLRFLLSLVDDSEKITHLADFLFSNILKGTVPKLCMLKIQLVFVQYIYVSAGNI